jgi:hypothetical protein
MKRHTEIKVTDEAGWNEIQAEMDFIFALYNGGPGEVEAILNWASGAGKKAGVQFCKCDMCNSMY